MTDEKEREERIAYLKGMLQKEEQQRRRPPQDALDYNMLVLESAWGKERIPNELRDKLVKASYFKDVNTGEVSVEKESLWGLLGFYSRDMRLANLDKRQFNYCTYYLDLANDFLQHDQVEPFLIALSRCATVLELSQSKGGFLRNRQNTLTSENIQRNLEPPKKSILTGKNKRETGG